jgi:AcrR family transcriptional regulator
MARRPRGSNDKQRTDHPTGQEIAVTVAEILKEKGPAEFHIDDVLERTGLTRGAIYHHFDNVDDLIESGLLIT